MRLAILDGGHRWSTKLLFAIIRAVTRQPILDVIKLVQYRPDFYAAGAVTHEAMRGPSEWSVGDRELMAAVVANALECKWCTRAHAAVAERAYMDSDKVAAVLADLDNAPIEEPLRATLQMLRKQTREQHLKPDDLRTVLATGVTRAQVRDALAVSFAFNMTARLAESFGFTLATSEGFASGAKYLLARGYR